MKSGSNLEKVLASGPSNTSVDNLLVRLARMDLNVVRMGHPARVALELQENTLDALVDRHENMAIAKEMIRESDEKRGKRIETSFEEIDGTCWGTWRQSRVCTIRTVNYVSVHSKTRFVNYST